MMTDYIMSVKLLVERLKLNHEAKSVAMRNTDTCLETSTSVHISPVSRQSQDKESTDRIVYRRKRYPESSSVVHYRSDESSNNTLDTNSRKSDVFQYPSVHEARFGNIITTGPSCLLPGGDLTTSPNRLFTGGDLTTSPNCLLTGGDLTTSPRCLLTLNSNTIYKEDIDNHIDSFTTPVPRYSPLTPSISGSSLEVSPGHGFNSPPLLESNNSLQCTSLGISSPRRSRSSSINSSKLRLSISKSVPLSPLTVTKETRERQLCDIQLKLDTIKAELMTLRKTKQELASQLLQLYSEIQVQKVKRSCLKHCELLDDAIYEAEIADELPTMLDAPYKSQNKLLTSHGVTSFNIACRRFSCS